MSKQAWQMSGGQDPVLRRLEDYEWLIRWGSAGGRLRVHAGIGAEIRREKRASPAAVAAAADLVRAKHAGGGAEIRRRIESYLQLELAAARLGAGDVLGGGWALARSWWLKPRLRAALEPFWTKVK